MIKNNEYALSYNVKEQVIDILESIRNFETWTRADDFVNWFNKLIELKGRVMMVEICKKMKKESIEPFERIGFNNAIRDSDIYKLTRIDRSGFYQVLFPVLKDFTIRGVQ